LVGNTERALNAYAHGFAVEQDISAWPSALRTCASLCLELGDPARAKALLDEAARHEPYVDDFEARLAEEVMPGDGWSTLAFFSKAGEFDRQRHLHRLLCAEVALVETGPDAAMEFLDRPWGVDWDQADGNFLFGLVLVARGQLSEAEAAYDEGLSFANNWTDVLAATRKLDRIHNQRGDLVGSQVIRQRLNDAEFRLKAGWPPAHRSGRPFEAEHSL